jgi:hypothetical protein
LYKNICPNDIHINGYHNFELDAAHELNIPLVLTVNEGGILYACGRGFLNWNDDICKVPISQINCYKY